MFWPALAGMQKLYCIVRLVFCLLTSVCFYLFQHLQKCAAALSSTHQESKGRSWSFLSGSFSCPNRWLVLLSCCSQGLCSCAGLCWLLIDTTHTHTHTRFPPSFCSSLFTGLEHLHQNTFLLIIRNTQTAMIWASLLASPAPLTPGQFSSTVHILEVSHSSVKALPFSIPAFVMSSANSLDCTHCFLQPARNYSFPPSIHILSPKDTAGS